MMGWFGTVLGRLAEAARASSLPENRLPLISKDSIRWASLVYPDLDSGYPEHVRKRKAVQRELTRDFDAQLKPLGYERKGGEWRKRSRCGISCFGFQKSTYGFDCYLNAGALAAFEAPNITFANTEDGISFYRMADFCPEMPYNDVADGLSYARLHDDPAFRNGVMTVFQARMLPWLEMRHASFRFWRMPPASVMRQVRIFSELD